jgi:hypothetical protein
MKKFVLIVIALLALSVIPSSLTSANVLAQGDEAQPAESDGICFYEDMRYSTGSYIRVATSDTTGLLLRCTRAEEGPRWELRTPDEIAQYLHGEQQ